MTTTTTRYYTISRAAQVADLGAEAIAQAYRAGDPAESLALLLEGVSRYQRAAGEAAIHGRQAQADAYLRQAERATRAARWCRRTGSTLAERLRRG
jgi:hypothetical protein